LKDKLQTNNEFSEKLLWKLIDASIEDVNLFLAENLIDELLEIEFQQEILFELAINYTDYEFSDEFIQFLLDNNHTVFKENVSFLKTAKKQIIQMERDHLRNHLNELDQIEEEVYSGKIVEMYNDYEVSAMFEPEEYSYNQIVSNTNKKQTKKIFKLSTFLKYAALLIIVPSIIALVYFGMKSPKVITASTSTNKTQKNKHYSKKELNVNQDSVITVLPKNKLKELVIPTMDETTLEISPSNYEGFDSYGFVSKTMNVVVYNLSNQIQYLKNTQKDLQQPKQIQNIQNKIDSIQGLNDSYEYDKTKSLLKLYTLLKLNNNDLKFYLANKLVRKNVLQIKNEYYEIFTTTKPTKLNIMVDEEFLR
jgi:hypothetical protein